MTDQAVVFLDFDGVICSPRAYIAQERRWIGREHSAYRWADPIACDLVHRLLDKHRAKLVISSTWRGMKDRCFQVLDRYRLSSFLHEDWRTGDDPKGRRGNEVRAWLEAHGNPPYLILDDDSDFDDDQRRFWVGTCPYNGMLYTQFEQADSLLASLSQEPDHD